MSCVTDAVIDSSPDSSGELDCCRANKAGILYSPIFEDEISMDYCGNYSLNFYPQCPWMISYQNRKKSFNRWPPQMKQKPEALAKSGFFYTHEGDKVKCFYCGVSLIHWESFDNVNQEHKKWSPFCKYLEMSCM